MLNIDNFTAEQIVQILATPLGKNYSIDDPVILAERKRISDKYKELSSTPRWFSPEELKDHPGHADKPGGAMLIPALDECSISARAWWLREHC